MNAHGHSAPGISEAAFHKLAELARHETGLALHLGKASMVASRLRPHARELGCPDLESYVALICSSNGIAHRQATYCALTTNVSQFFREDHHFDLLVNQILPDLRARSDGGEPIRIWSAGCSTGQEPYSIAMILLHHAPDLCQRDLLILASDIDDRVLDHARRGVFTTQEATQIPDALRERYMQIDSSGAQVAEPVRNLIRFRQLNLMADWPMERGFDLIFCRNVIIYFDADTRADLVPRLHGALKPDSYLILGHSERVEWDNRTLFETVGSTTYRAVSPGNSARHAASRSQTESQNGA